MMMDMFAEMLENDIILLYLNDQGNIELRRKYNDSTLAECIDVYMSLTDKSKGTIMIDDIHFLTYGEVMDLLEKG